MSGRHTSREWRRDPFADEPTAKDRLEAAKYITDHFNFWEYVDSQRVARSHPGKCEEHPTDERRRVWEWSGYSGDCQDWEHLRGNPLACIAASSSLQQCGYEGIFGMPFCDFHFDRVWLYICAAVQIDKHESAVEIAQHRVKHERDRLNFDEAAVADAKTVLAKSNERVYFYLADHAVKIGRSIHPERRVRSLGTTKAPEGINVQLGTLLGTIPGGAKVESCLHLCYREFRLVGEWFEYEPISDEIAACIAEYAEAGAA